MTNSVPITAGSGTNVSTYQSTRDSQTEHQQLVCPLPPNRLLITASSSATSPTNLFAAQGAIDCILYAGAPDSGLSPTLTIYDEGSSPSGSANDIVFQGQLTPGQFVPWHCPLVNGLSYKISAAPASGCNIIVAYWQGT